MRPKVLLIWFLTLSLSAQTTLRGAEPQSAPTAPANVPPSVEKVLELQKLVELADSPDWVLVMLGIGVGFWGGKGLMGDVSTIVTTSLPAAVKLHRAIKILKMGEDAEKALLKLGEDLRPLGKEAKVAADSLQNHLNNVPKRMSHRSNLQNQKFDEVRDHLAKPGVRETISETAAGKTWLGEYDRLLKEQQRTQAVLLERFVNGTATLSELSGKANRLAHGYLRMEDLAHRPLKYDAVPMQFGPIGGTNIYMDGGFIGEVPDPRNLTLFAHGPLTRCGDLIAKIRAARDRNLVQLKVDSVVKPSAHLATLGLGLGLYRWGASLVQHRTNNTPDVLLEQQKSKAQAETFREIIRSGELNNLTDQLREARKTGKDQDVREVYRVFREALRQQLPEMAESIRQKTDPVLREKADFEKNLWAFLRNDEMADAIFDVSLGEAARLEAKTTSPETVFNLLLSSEVESKPQVDRLLMRHYGTALKFLWPKLTFDGNAIPVDAAHIADAVSASGPKLQEIIKARTLKKSTSTTGEPKVPGILPAAQTSLETAPAKGEVVLSSAVNAVDYQGVR